MRNNHCEHYLDISASNIKIAYDFLEDVYTYVGMAFDGDEPGYPAPDSLDARAWDYLDAIGEAQRALGHRLNTWDEGTYSE